MGRQCRTGAVEDAAHANSGSGIARRGTTSPEKRRLTRCGEPTGETEPGSPGASPDGNSAGEADAVRGPVSPLTQARRMSDRRHQYSAELDREWQHLRRRRASIATARSWAPHVDPPLAAAFHDITDLGELVDATQRDAAGRGERVLLTLVRLARRDQLAGRIVVQRLLPGLIAGSTPYRAVCAADPVQLAVGSLWIAIHSYDHERRRRHVAASLLSDAIFKSFRQQARRRAATEEVCAPTRFDELAATNRTDPLVEIAAALREARGAGVPVDDIDLLRALVRVGSPRLIAAACDVTPRTVRNRRDRAVHRVRMAVAVDAA